MNPNGVITFLSSLYGGRISDRELTKRSGLLSLLEAGDSVMVDCRFNIAELFPEGTHINIPPLLGGQEQLDHAELVETRRISSVRIHVERAIEHKKIFHTFFQLHLL